MGILGREAEKKCPLVSQRSHSPAPMGWKPRPAQPGLFSGSRFPCVARPLSSGYGAWAEGLSRRTEAGDGLRVSQGICLLRAVFGCRLGLQGKEQHRAGRRAFSAACMRWSSLGAGSRACDRPSLCVAQVFSVFLVSSEISRLGPSSFFP